MTETLTPPKNSTATPARRRRADERAGTLVLIGGACDPLGPALGTFIELTGARNGEKIVGLTTASSNPLQSALAWKDDFAAAGAKNVEIPIVDRRDRAQDPRLAEMVLQAKGIFLGGGDQVLLVSTIGGSRLRRALPRALSRGAAVFGPHAG